MRLDKYLKEKYPEYSRAFFQKLISSHKVLVNGHPLRVHEDVTDEDKIEITWPENRPIERSLPDTPLDILYEDTDILVVNKPAGIVVHPALGNPTGTLIEQVAEYCGFTPEEWSDTLRPGLVHRLDKDTSGCLLIAKNVLSHNILAKSMIARHFQKEYLAVVVGSLPAKKGMIDAPLGRARHDHKQMAVSANADARSAQTEFTVVESVAWEKTRLNLVQLKLLTGRTHQIRVHMRAVGCSVLGDITYGKPHYNALGAEQFGIKRQALHAWFLAFPHPETHRMMKVAAPVPADIRNVFKEMGWKTPPMPKITKNENALASRAKKGKITQSK